MAQTVKGKESASPTGDPGLIPGLGRCPGEGSGNPLQYSCLEKPVKRRAWRTTVHRITVRHNRVTNPFDFTFRHPIEVICWWSVFSTLSLLAGEPTTIPGSSLSGFQLRQRQCGSNPRGELKLNWIKGKPESFWNLLQQLFTECPELTDNIVMRTWASQRRGAVVMDRPRATEKRGGAGWRRHAGQDTWPAFERWAL